MSTNQSEYSSYLTGINVFGETYNAYTLKTCTTNTGQSTDTYSTRELMINEYWQMGKYGEAADEIRALRDEDPEKSIEYTKLLYEFIKSESSIKDQYSGLRDQSYTFSALEGNYIGYLTEKGVHRSGNIGSLNSLYHVSLDLYEADYKESLKILENHMDKPLAQQILCQKAYIDDTLSDEERKSVMEKHADECVALTSKEGHIMPDINYYSLKTRATPYVGNDLRILDVGYEDALEFIDDLDITHPSQEQYAHKYFQLLYHKLSRDTSLSDGERASMMKKIEEKYSKFLYDIGKSGSDIEKFSKILKSMAHGDNKYSALVDAMLSKDYDKAFDIKGKEYLANGDNDYYMDLLDMDYDSAMQSLKGKHSDNKTTDLHKEYRLLYHKLFRDKSISEAERTSIMQKIEEQYIDYLMKIGVPEGEDIANLDEEAVSKLEEFSDKHLSILKAMSEGDNNYSRFVDAILEKDYEKMCSLYYAKGLDYKPDTIQVK